MNKKHNSYSKELFEITKELIPLNNDMFALFAMNILFCQEFLRVLLQDKNLIVLDNDIQKHLPDAYFKSYTIDMLCRLSDDRVVNVEIQLEKELHHAKRIFQYASAIKHILIEKGGKYKDVKDLIVIYLTKEDMFKRDCTIYHVEHKIVTDGGDVVEDWDAGLTVYYVNTEGLSNETIHNYLQILADSVTYDSKYEEVTKLKNEYFTRGGNIQMGRLQQLFEKVKQEGKAEGIAEGKAEGIAEGKLEGMFALIKKLFYEKIVDAAYAAKELGMTEQEFLKMVK